MAADAITVEIVYPYPVEHVWKALTNRDSLAAWLMPNDFEPQIGHKFTFRAMSDKGWTGTIYCQIVALEPPHRVAYTWRGDPNQWETLVTFDLESTEGGTRLRLEHTGFEAGGKMGSSARDMMASGWGTNILRERLFAFLGKEAQHATSSNS